MGYTVALLTGGSETQRAFALAGALELREALGQAGHRVWELSCDEDLTAALLAKRPDVVWPVLPGTLGESGAVQGLVEALGIPCVGSPAPVCRRLRNKADLARTIGEAVALHTIEASMPWTECLHGACLRELGAQAALELMAKRIPGGFPLVVKPACGCFGDGVRTVEDAGKLPEAALAALEHGDEVLLQEQVEGVEVTVGILGDVDDLQVLPPVELCANGERHVPVRYASLAAERSNADAIRSEIERAALDAYLVCGCRDLAEVDLVWDGAQARILDVNTSPRLDGSSTLAAALKACGIEPSEAFGALVECAAERG